MDNITVTRQLPRMMTISQTAKETGFSEHALRRLVKSGEIVHVKLGTKVMINLDKFIEFLNRGEQL